ncbi:hypothetical protein [Rufibacter ruber]|uniref:hypothetical protein n=1 Tax=Rufibacter ruber TaxID=1783499 RepID=UPI0008303654|nr:hypothetical protein [Rufibacter ruber]
MLDLVDKREKVIYLTTMGNVSEKAAMAAKHEIESFYRLNVEIIDKTNLPKGAFCEVRKRYVAKSLLNHLKGKNIAGSAGKNYKIISLTNKDIETEDGSKHWGIMGLGKLGGDQSVVSYFRMNDCKKRFDKVVLHEVGHMLAIDHCSSKDSKCFMKDAKGKGSNVDRTLKHLCTDCKRNQAFY